MAKKKDVMYDFGELGKWSRETLLVNNYEYYGSFCVSMIEMTFKVRVDDLLKSRQSIKNGGWVRRKENRKREILEAVESYLAFGESLKEVQTSYNKYQETMREIKTSEEKKNDKMV